MTASDAPPPRAVVYLGNRDACEADPDSEIGERRAIPGKQCTKINVAAGVTLALAVHEITGHMWPAHSYGDRPAWVASTDPALAALLAEHWSCELRDPDPDPDPDHQTSGSEEG